MRQRGGVNPEVAAYLSHLALIGIGKPILAIDSRGTGEGGRPVEVGRMLPFTDPSTQLPGVVAIFMHGQVLGLKIRADTRQSNVFQGSFIEFPDQPYNVYVHSNTIKTPGYAAREAAYSLYQASGYGIDRDHRLDSNRFEDLAELRESATLAIATAKKQKEDARASREAMLKFLYEASGPLFEE